MTMTGGTPSVPAPPLPDPGPPAASPAGLDEVGRLVRGVPRECADGPRGSAGPLPALPPQGLTAPVGARFPDGVVPRAGAGPDTVPALARARAEGAAGLAGPRAAAHLQPPSPAPSDRVSGALRRPPRPGAAPVGRADAPGGDDRPAVPPEPTPPNPRPGAADVGGLLAAAVRAGRAAREGSTERSAAERGGARAGGTAGVHTREASTA